MNAPKLDRIDIKILAELQKNGRISNVELADAVGLSPSPCLTRVKRLEQSGYVSGYGAKLNLRKFGEFVTVFAQVTLQDSKASDLARFESKVFKVDEMMECHSVSGGHDYWIKFVSPSIEHYRATSEALIESGIGIEKYFSYIVLRSPFEKSGAPVHRLFPRGG